MLPAWPHAVLNKFLLKHFFRNNSKWKHSFRFLQNHFHFATNCVEFPTNLWSCFKVCLFHIDLGWMESDLSCSLHTRVKMSTTFYAKPVSPSILATLGRPFNYGSLRSKNEGRNGFGDFSHSYFDPFLMLVYWSWKRHLLDTLIKV